jgi:hypothetical protein
MSKIIIKMQIILVIFNFHVFQSVGQTIDSVNLSGKYFCGYVDKRPVFGTYGNKEHSLYVLNEDGLIKLLDFPDNYVPVLIQDSFIAYSVKEKNEYYLVISNHGNERQFIDIPTTPWFAFDTVGNLYMTSSYPNNEIYVIRDTQVNKIGLRGDVIDVIDNYLYFSKHNKKEPIGPLEDIYEYNLTTQEKPKLILSGMLCNPTRMFKNRKFISDVKMPQGYPIIYDIENKSIFSIETKYNLTGYNNRFYSYQEDALIYYGDNKMLKIEMP